LKKKEKSHQQRRRISGLELQFLSLGLNLEAMFKCGQHRCQIYMYEIRTQFLCWHQAAERTTLHVGN